MLRNNFCDERKNVYIKIIQRVYALYTPSDLTGVPKGILWIPTIYSK